MSEESNVDQIGSQNVPNINVDDPNEKVDDPNEKVDDPNEKVDDQNVISDEEIRSVKRRRILSQNESLNDQFISTANLSHQNDQIESDDDDLLHIPFFPQLGDIRDGPATKFTEDVKNIRTLCVRGLPEWIDENELKLLFIRAKEALSELRVGLGFINQQCVTGVQIIRDPESQKCIGYGYVELIDTATAAFLLKSQTSPHLQIPGSNKPLSLFWAPGPVNPSSVLENYHFYIGNIRHGLTDRAVAQLLRAIHPSVLSVRLIPQEVLGLAPVFFDSRSADNSTLDPVERGLLSSSSASFYRATRPFKQADPPQLTSTQPSSSSAKKESSDVENVESTNPIPTDEISETERPKIERPKTKLSSFKSKVKSDDSRRWGCGFIRIRFCGNEWKKILRILKEKINGEMGTYLRRDQSLEPDHPSSLIIIRPIFNKFDEPNRLDSSISVKREHAGNVGEPSKTTVFVGSLADDTTEQDINAIFSPFGRVLSIRVAFLKHVGFIEMSDHRSALAALSHLRGAQIKKSKLHFDWGRTRPSHLILPRHVEIESVVDHSSFLSEKTYASRWIQSMQPQTPAAELEQILPKSSTESSSPQPPKSYWLASLCASLPTRPKEHEDVNNRCE